MATLSSRQSVVPSPSGRAAAAHLGQALQPRSLSLSSRALAGHLGIARRYTDTTSLLTPRRLSPPPPPLPDFHRLQADAQRLQQQVAVQESIRIARPVPAPPTAATPSVAAEQQAFRRFLQQMRAAVLEDYNRTRKGGGNPAIKQHLLQSQLHFLGTLDHLLHPAGPAGPDSFMEKSFWKSQAPKWTNCAGTVYAMLAAYYGKNYHQPTAWYDLVLEHQTVRKPNGISVRDKYIAAPAGRAAQGMAKLDEYMANHQPVMVGVSHTLNFYLPSKHKDGTTTYSIINNGTIDHFVALVGTGVDEKGKYYRFFDVGTKFQKKGTDPRNRLYYDAATGFYRGRSYATDNEYVLVQVRF